MRRFLSIVPGLAVFALLSGCAVDQRHNTSAEGEGSGNEGEGLGEGEGEGEGAAPDAGTPADAGGPGPGVDSGGPAADLGEPGADQGLADPCGEGCGPHASCTAQGCRCWPGYMPGPAGLCISADPCAGVSCPALASCDAGTCVCQAGYVLQGDSCVAQGGGGPLEARTQDEVCTRWRAERVDVQPEWQPTPGSNDACDPGTVPDRAQQNAIRRVNLVRWMAGLLPITLDGARLPTEQACAVVEAGMGSLSHTPPADAPCYTQAGADGAGSSNISQGAGLAESVELYVGDQGVPSLGHRRWVLNPSMAVTAFGFKADGTPFGCMYSFSMEASVNVDQVTWPPAGFVPADAPPGRWHVTFYGASMPTAATTVTLTADGGAAQQLAVEALPDGYGGWNCKAIAFDPPANLWAAGHTVHVTVGHLTGADFSYTVRFVACPG